MQLCVLFARSVLEKEKKKIINEFFFIISCGWDQQSASARIQLISSYMLVLLCLTPAFTGL